MATRCHDSTPQKGTTWKKNPATGPGTLLILNNKTPLVGVSFPPLVVTGHFRDN